MLARHAFWLSRELVLDYVVERKRIDDLVASIRDGRYREQKFRFARSGINRPIYLVENAGWSARPCYPCKPTFTSEMFNQHSFERAPVNLSRSDRAANHGWLCPEASTCEQSGLSFPDGRDGSSGIRTKA